MKISIIGLGGMPFSKRAIDARLKATADLFCMSGHSVEFINRYSPQKNGEKFENFSVWEPFNGKKSGNKLIGLLLYVVALFGEPFKVIRSNKEKHIDVLFVNSGHYFDMLVYKLLCKITGAKFLYQYCEFRSALPTRNPYHKMNGKLVGNKGPKLWDGVTPISHFLDEHSHQVNPNLKSLLMYPLCDFSEFVDVTPFASDKPYVLFCGSIEYKEIVDFISDAFHRSKLKSTHNLVMVLRGNQSEINAFREKHPAAIVVQNLPYKDLIARFKGADALLIPLKNDIRDIARFPNKIGEYSAAKGLIVTTDNGEMRYLFKDKVNALVADDFTVEAYTEKLNWLAENLDKVDTIKEVSYQLGLASFDIASYKDKLNTFLDSLVK